MKTLQSNSLVRDFITLVTMVAVIMATTFFVTPANGSTEGARRTARRLLNVLSDKGWNVRDTYSTGTLSYRQSVYIRTTLYAGNSYQLVAAGCEDAFDVDIAVYDENGNFIEGDRDESSLAVALFSPAWTGMFIIKVTMYDSTYNGAHYVMQYAWTD